MSRVDDIIRDVKKRGVKKEESRVDSIIKKTSNGNLKTDVNEDYINTFFRDVENYFSNANTDSKNIGYSNASSYYDKYSSMGDGLRKRANAIRAYANSNKNNIEEDFYKSLISSLDSFDRSRGSLTTQLRRNSEFYSKFKTEDEYKKAVEDAKAYQEEWQKNSTLDLNDLESTIDDLESLYSDVQKHDERAKKGERSHLVLRDRALQQRGFKSLEELRSHIYGLQESYDKAYWIQNTNRVNPESEYYDPESAQWVEKGKAIKNPSVGDATGVYAFGLRFGDEEVENPVTYTRDNWDKYTKENPNMDGGSLKASKLNDLYMQMEEEEVNAYSALLAQDKVDGGNRAEKYLNAINETLEKRKSGELSKPFTEAPALGLVFNTAYSFAKFGHDIEDFVLNTEGEKSDPSVADYMAQTIAQENADAWGDAPAWLGKDDFGNNKTWYGIASDVTGTVGYMLPSILAAKLTGGASLKLGASQAVAKTASAIAGSGSMGLAAAGSGYQEMIDLGYSKEQARTYGIMIGAAEGLTSYALSGISDVGGKLTGNFIKKAADKIDNAIGRFAVNLGGHIGSEILEEEVQLWLEPAIKDMVLGIDFEAPTADDMLYTALVTAFSTFLLESPNAASTEIKNYKDGKNIKSQGTAEVDRLVSIGKTFSADTVAGQIAGKVNKDTGAYTIGRLFNEMGASLSSQNVSDITKVLVEKGFTPEQAKKHVDTLLQVTNRMSSGKELTKRQQVALNSNPVLAQVLNDVLINPNSTVNQRNMAYRHYSELSKSKSKANVSDTAEIYSDPETVKAIVEEGIAAPEGTQSKVLATEYNKILENGGTLSTEQVEKLVSANQEAYPAEETPVKYGVDKFGKVQVSLDTEGETTDVKTFDKTTGEEVAFKEFSEISQDGKVAKLRLENGREISAKDLSIGNRSDALIVEGLLNMTVDNAHIDADTANALLKEARNGIHPSTIQSDVRIRLYGIKEALTYGYYGYDSKQLMSDNGMAAEISDSLRSTAYILGRDLGKERRASNQAKITNAIEDRKQSGVKKAEAKGKLGIDAGTKNILEKLSSDQKAVVNFFRDVAVAMPSGLRVTQKLVVGEDGKKREVNGLTNATTGEMVFSLDSNASNDPVAAVLFTAGHESGHYIKLYNPEGFRRLGEFLAKEYGKKGESVNAIVREKMDAHGYTYDQAHEEWVCQSLQRMFASVINNKDSGVLQRLQQYDNKVAKLLYEALSKLASKISSLLEKITPKTKEEQFVAEMDATMRKIFESMYAEELVTAIDNAQWLSGVDVMTEILGNKSIEVGQTSIQEMNRRQTHFQERTEFEAQPKEIISVGTDAKKPKANRKTLGGRNKVTIAGKTFKGDVSVKELRDARFKENGFSQKKIDKHNEFIQHMADMMEEARIKYRFIGLDDIYNAKILISPTSGEITLSALVNNGDYPINFDFTKICKKRVALQQIVDQLARQKGKVNADGSVTEVNLSPENIKAINDILAEAGIETACLCCFVESKRFNIQSLVQENVIDVWNSLVDEFDSDAEYFNFADESVNDSKIPDKEFDALYEQVVAWRKQKGKSDIPKEKMQQFLETTPAARKKLRFSDLVTEKGRTNLHKLYPDIESLIGSTLGTAAPKSVEAFAPYNGEIDLMESTSETGMREYLFSIAGARSQSFSDFMIAHIFDVVQKTASLSARKFPAHVYTKEIARARLFGMTGEKHNMSVLFNIDPEVDSWNAGLKKDGSYFLSDYKAYKSGESQYIQSIGWDEAVNLQNTEGYSKDCGIIAVGFSYNNMIKIHNDPDVRQVIGYHTSSLPAVVKPLTNLDKATDYTPVQNTLEFVGFVKPMYAIPEGVPSYATPPQDVQPIKGKAKTQQVDDTFDIKATFKKLAKGKKGEARTQAAKETLRQFLEYAESNGLALKTKKAEGGHGDFDLYSDVAKTKNPYKSADHYIEYCIERGYLPAFFEFSMNPNYYKDIFDFNVFDRLSYNPETGLHEDSDGRQAYAPQTAVHMLNEDGSYAFPSDFFDIVDKQMKNYDEYSQMVEKKMPSVMEAITSIDGMGSNLKLQEKNWYADIQEDALYPTSARERSAFNRSMANKTSHLKNKEIANIMIYTADNAYFISANGYMSGKILHKEKIDGNEDLINTLRKEFQDETLTTSEGLDSLIQGIRNDRGRGYRRHASLKEILAAEGYEDLDTESHIGNSRRSDSRSNKTSKEQQRESLTPEQQKHYDYNAKQEAVGSSLKTLKGSTIKRSTKYGVGKEIGGEIYFHKDYAEDIMPPEVLSQAEHLLEENHSGFEYNCLKYNPKTGVVAFQEAPDFDSAREPIVGDYVSVNTNTGVVKTGHSNYIWHHKWNWVKNDYSGFDVRESWEWSKEWLSTLTEVSDGNGIERWNAQLDKFGLPHDGESKTSVLKYQLREVDPVKPSNSDWRPAHNEAWFAENGFPLYRNVSEEQRTANEQHEMDKRSGGHGTQNKSTLPTYEKIFKFIKDRGDNPRILDASAGLGLGTELGKKYGLDIHDIEPFPNENYKPEWTDYEGLQELVESGKEKPFDIIISNAVLNVLAQDSRDNLVAAMDSLLRDGGQMFINVIGKDYAGAKNASPEIQRNSKGIPVGTVLTQEGENGAGREVFVWQSNSVQKVFSSTELKSYLQDALGDGYVVDTPAKAWKGSGLSGTMVVVTKPSSNGQVMYQERDNVGYHAGDLGKSEYYFMQGSDRDTGHFGTGTYFVGNNELVKNYNKRNGVPAPQHAVDFSDYNLYKIKSDKDGYELHKQLRVIDGGLRQDFYDKAAADEFMFYPHVNKFELAEKKYKTETNSWDEAYVPVNQEIADMRGIQYQSLEEWCKEQGYDPNEEYIESYYNDYLEETIKKETEKVEDKYSEFRDAYFQLWLRFGHQKTRQAIQKTINYQKKINPTGERDYWREHNNKYDSLATVFMKSLGYEGIDVRGTGLDNTAYGSVIYDLKQDTILYQERSTEDISNRGLLANALESAATDGEEKNLLRNYKTNIRLIEAEQKKLSEIKDKLFAKGSKIDPEERKKLQFEMKQTATRINSYDRELLKLEAMQPIKKVLNREKEMAKKRQKQKDMQLLAEYKEKSKATVRELLERNQESRQKAIEGREKTFMRNKIKGVVNDLNQLLLKGTKDKHVMIGLQKAVASALDAVNMDTVGADERIAKYDALIAKAKDPDVIASLTATRDRIAEQGDKMSEKLAALKSSYADIKNSKDPLIANSHDEVIENKIESVVNSVGNTPLRNMTLDQLEDVYDLYKMVLTTIRNSNKTFKMDKTKTIAILGNNIMGEIHSAAGEKKYVPVALEGLKKFGWSSLKPTQAFETIGSGTFKNLFANVRAGEDTWAVDVNEAREYYREKTSKYGYDSWDFKQRYEFTSKSGKKFSLSLEQIMSLYAYSKRKQADLHLEQGGFVFDEAIEVSEKKLGFIPVKYKVNTANAYSISKEELGNIIGTLSDRQRFFVDEMQAYLSDVMGAKGNEVSLEMYGVKLFKEQFYFPLKSASQFMFEQNEVAGEVRIKNSSFSKETVAKANNPIILSNFMDVWANHVNDMSMYHAFVLPLEDFNRVFNYKTPTSDKYNPESVKSYLQNAYGTQPVQYIKQLITDLNGGARSDASAGFVNKGISLFKKGAVFASASVVIQQPSAIARAFAYINPIYFATAKVDLTKHSRDWEECKQYAPVATIKEMGYFDTNVGPQTTEWITAKEYKGFGEKIKAVFTDSNYRDEILSKAPALADELAWTHIWNAVKKEIASTTDLKVGTEEFLKRAGERFTEVIVNTQVYDSVLSRSGLMRSKDTGVKMATAFMAEPTTSLNMIVNAVVQSKRGNKKFARNIVGGVVSSIILNSILVSFVYAGRDDDEDETYIEKYLGSLTSELLDGFNPITYIPFAKDIWSIAQGYNVERSDMSTYSKLWQSFEELFDENKSALDKVLDFSGSVANLFGLPIKNITRDVMAVYNTVANDLGISDTTMAGVGDSAADALRNSVPLLGRFYKEDTKAQKLYDAILGGNATEISRAKSQFKDDEAIDTALKKALRENDPRIKEAAQARIDGDITKYKSIATSITSEGHFSQDLVVKAINAEINKTNKEADEADSSSDDEEEETKATSIYKASDINVALENGNTSDALAVIDDLVKVKTENYIAEGEKKSEAKKKAESSVRSSVTSYWKKLYLEAYQSKDKDEMLRIRKLLKETKLYDNVVETCQDWVKNSKK